MSKKLKLTLVLSLVVALAVVGYFYNDNKNTLDTLATMPAVNPNVVPVAAEVPVNVVAATTEVKPEAVVTPATEVKTEAVVTPATEVKPESVPVAKTTNTKNKK